MYLATLEEKKKEKKKKRKKTETQLTRTGKLESKQTKKLVFDVIMKCFALRGPTIKTRR